MALRVIKEVNRMPGNSPKTGNSILEGHVVQRDGEDIELFDGTGEPLGLAADSNVLFPLTATNPSETAGTGYDYNNFNRGGLIGIFLNGGVFELSGDSRGHPVDTSQAYVENGIVYGDVANGKVTSVAGGNTRIGRILEVEGSGSTLKLTIVLEI